jgi:hypothetical protein
MLSNKATNILKRGAVSSYQFESNINQRGQRYDKMHHVRISKGQQAVEF